MTKRRKKRGEQYPVGSTTTWRPERQERAHVYSVMRKFREANPQISKAQFIDMCIACFLSQADAECRVLYEADVIRWQPRFGNVTDRSSNIDIPPDNPMR